MRKNAIDKYIDQQGDEVQRTETDIDGLYRLMLGGEWNPTQREFVYASDRIKAYKGPAGCAKTTTLAVSALGRAILQPGFKGLISRLDYNDLMGTTLDIMESTLSRLPKGILIGRDKSPPMKWTIQPALGGAPSVIWFMGFKEALGSWRFNYVGIDEADEVEEKRVHEANSRLRAEGGNYALDLFFNPPSKDHWLYTACTGYNARGVRVCDPWMRLFEPRPRENAHNLADPEYYERLTKTLPADMKSRLVDGDWGTSFSGSPVFREFVPATHCRSGLKKRFTPSAPLLRFWDFGYNRPACIWAQVDWQGRLMCFFTELGHEEEATAFARRVKTLTAARFPDAADILDYGDPAVRQMKDTGSALSVLRKEGIHIRYKIQGKGSVDKGIGTIRRLLTTTASNEPMLQFDKDGCSTLIDAFKGGYRMKDDGSEPLKDGFYDHLADAYRYGIDNVYGIGTSSRLADTMHMPANIGYGGHYGS